MEQGKPLSASDSPLIDFDSVCEKLRAAIEPARCHAISLHDELGDVLWLSEGSMGPDEHNAVREAAEAFANPTAAPVLAFDLGDSRSAVMVRAINARRAMVGMVMMIMDTRNIARGPSRLMTPKLQKALVEFAATRPDRGPPLPSPSASVSGPASASGLHAVPNTPPRAAPQRAAPTSAAASPAAASPAAVRTARPPAAPPRVAATPAASMSAAPAPAPSSATAKPQRTSGPSSTPKAGPAATSAGAPKSIAAQLQQIASRTAPKVNPAAASPPAAPAVSRLATSPEFSDQQAAHTSISPEIDRLHAALRKSPIALYVQRLMPLTKGSQTKRYEVLLRSSSDNSPNAAPHAMLKAAVENGLGSMIDRRVISELIGWLIRHPDIWQSNEVMFSVNLTSTALHDEHFIKFVELCLAKSELPRGSIAFEIDAPTALTLADKISDVAAALHRLGCPLVLDDFALRTECFTLLRLPGVRYVKLSSEITAKMRTDKISQAAITAVVQMAHVLGMHTVAKRTETAAEQEWLTALGVDFVQSNSISPPISIDSLSKAPNTKI
jgi:EAL domain-containing protein (putative c-di-GMP-specific phosphodiesterase class I)